MTQRHWKVASTIAIAVLGLIAAVALYLAWFQVDDCAGAMRQTEQQSPELYRSLVPQCAAYGETYSKLKWLSLLVLPLAFALWGLPRRKQKPR